MHEVEKKNVALSATGSLPVAELRNSSLVEATYRLVLRRPASHPSGARGETIGVGDLGDDVADEWSLNFLDKALSNGSDLDGCTLSVLASYASASDNPTQNVSITVVVKQDGKEVANGRASHEEQFTRLGGVVIRFRLQAV